ncbi:hypothetical protein TNIN_56601 [Trichonephila inaurata madagascariensis]|uniref:Uncharacterized protein n=1 Tax=Trichonephila inaurata madagascariensis TaxID=2747483 RepID=A0A8X6YYK0_9ARAC|nr:hypothetical protein TNIN_56601 [Trichonephila inaurata madagascariensis]
MDADGDKISCHLLVNAEEDCNMQRPTFIKKLIFRKSAYVRISIEHGRAGMRKGEAVSYQKVLRQDTFGPRIVNNSAFSGFQNSKRDNTVSVNDIFE